MTRKQALSSAIETLKNNGEYDDVVEKLIEISDEMPFNRWTDKAIRDSVEQFIVENGRVPTATDFKKPFLPPHPVFKLRYNITLAEWLEKNYPRKRLTPEQKKNMKTETFIKEYNMIEPTTACEFNTKRVNSITWQALALYYEVTSWRKLLEILKLPVYYETKVRRNNVQFKVNISCDVNFDGD